MTEIASHETLMKPSAAEPQHKEPRISRMARMGEGEYRLAPFIRAICEIRGCSLRIISSREEMQRLYYGFQTAYIRPNLSFIRGFYCLPGNMS
jgi:hypothetical protein